MKTISKLYQNYMSSFSYKIRQIPIWPMEKVFMLDVVYDCLFV